MARATFLRACRAGFLIHAALCVAIAAGAYLGVLPTSIDIVSYADKVGHVVLCGLLGGLLDGALAFRPLAPGLGPWPRLGPVIVLAIAGVEELAQSLSARRSSSGLDYAADVAGVLAFSWLARAIYGWSRPGG